MAKKQTWNATGRRKSSVAKVTLVGGTGNITVNGVDVHDYMPYETLVMDLTQPLVLTDNLNRFDIDVKVSGGGFSGQTGAIRLGITRALLKFDENTDGYFGCSGCDCLSYHHRRDRVHFIRRRGKKHTDGHHKRRNERGAGGSTGAFCNTGI